MSLDIKISRRYVINTKDFNNVESIVELVLKDVDEKDYNKKFIMLSKLVDYSQAIELHSALTEAISISGKDHPYLDVLNDNIDQIKTNMKLVSKKLAEMEE